MDKKKLEEIIERERNFSHSIWEENRELRKKLYEPYTHDDKIKEMAVEFGKFLITMKVRQLENGLYKTNTGLAPDMLSETLEQMYDRILQSKIPI